MLLCLPDVWYFLFSRSVLLLLRGVGEDDDGVHFLASCRIAECVLIRGQAAPETALETDAGEALLHGGRHA